MMPLGAFPGMSLDDVDVSSWVLINLVGPVEVSKNSGLSNGSPDLVTICLCDVCMLCCTARPRAGHAVNPHSPTSIDKTEIQIE
jgi:hypothetical protein